MEEVTIRAFLSNYILICAVSAWAAAQIIKFLLTLALTGKPRLERLTGSGGMPSSHTAMVCAATIAAARAEGMGSSVFAIALVMACIVMYDATGVRRQAGEQAKMINKIAHEHDDDSDNDDLLKEKLGHTPLEVLGGALLGILVAVSVGYIYY